MMISRGSTALLLLDLQRDFLDLDGVYARHGLPVHRLRGIIPPIARVAAASRAAHVPIFASKFTVYTYKSMSDLRKRESLTHDPKRETFDRPKLMSHAQSHMSHSTIWINGFTRSDCVSHQSLTSLI